MLQSTWVNDILRVVKGDEYMKKAMLTKMIETFGPKIHGNKKLTQEEDNLLDASMYNLRRELEDEGVDTQNVSNRELYNIYSTKDTNTVRKTVAHMKKQYKRTGLLKELEAAGAEMPDDIKRAITVNSLNTNQKTNKLPVAYRYAAADLHDAALPTKAVMISEIMAHWEQIRDDPNLIKLQPSQRIEMERVLSELYRMEWMEVGYFYSHYYENSDLFEKLQHPYDADSRGRGRGTGSLYTPEMIDIKGKIEFSKGKTYTDVKPTHQEDPNIFFDEEDDED